MNANADNGNACDTFEHPSHSVATCDCCADANRLSRLPPLLQERAVWGTKESCAGDAGRPTRWRRKTSARAIQVANVRMPREVPRCYRSAMTLHIETPYLRLAPCADDARQLWVKLESLQPAGSFKLRGIGARCEEAVAAGATRLVSSSGGNAGYATAWAGRALSIPVSVVVPETTGAEVRTRLAALGAEVRVAGRVWDEAHVVAGALAAETGGALIHPFDDATVWRGHATMIEEMARQGPRPDAIVVAVGGGGLLVGMLEGMARVGWDDVPVVAVEARGAPSLSVGVAAGAPVDLERVDTIAVTLAPRRVCQAAIDACRTHAVRIALVEDARMVAACVRFLDDARVLVEPACGAPLAVHYDRMPELGDARRIAVIGCGGIGVSLAKLRAWATQFGIAMA